jgi:metal-sulfur cluster biosynthetic enzyme
MISTDRHTRYLEALKDVEDPEIPISIVDMGLIVDIRVRGDTVEVDVTFTAMGCPAMDMILEGIERRLLAEPDVRAVETNIVWEPIWTKERLTPEGVMAMREWGISV